MWRKTETEKKLFNVLSNVGDDFIVFDVETSGLSCQKDRVIQISAQKFIIEENYKLHFISSFNEYINPGFFISDQIENLTGITNDFLSEKLTEEFVFPLIYDFFGNCPNVAAYNSKFDVGFLSEMYHRYGKTLKNEVKPKSGPVKDLTTAIDVLQMARDLVDKTETENYKLGSICKAYGIDDGIDWHSSDSDVEATVRLINVLVQEYLDRNGKKNDVPKERAAILSIRFWNGFKGHHRVYVNTNFGSFYYDAFNKYWGEKEENTMEKIDMNLFLEDVLKKARVSNEEELVKKYKKEFEDSL